MIAQVFIYRRHASPFTARQPLRLDSGWATAFAEWAKRAARLEEVTQGKRSEPLCFTSRISEMFDDRSCQAYNQPFKRG
jgi:hypothetical protein